MISGVRKNIIPQNVTVDICVSGWSRYLFLGKIEVFRKRIEICSLFLSSGKLISDLKKNNFDDDIRT